MKILVSGASKTHRRYWDEPNFGFLVTPRSGRVQEIDEAVAEAKRLGKWVHIGRVNTLRRMRHFYNIGVDSIDGTTFSKWPDRYFPLGLKWLRQLRTQPNMFAERSR